jgi:hypothetical protein
MVRFEQLSPATPSTAWQLLAQPARWSAWAPHIRGAIGLGSPEVELGRRGVALVGLLAPVPVHVTAKSDGEYWDWTTGLLRIRHRVEPVGDGCRVSIEVHAPGPVEPLVAATYGPVIRWVLQRLASLAAAAPLVAEASPAAEAP